MFAHKHGAHTNQETERTYSGGFLSIDRTDRVCGHPQTVP